MQCSKPCIPDLAIWDPSCPRSINTMDSMPLSWSAFLKPTLFPSNDLSVLTSITHKQTNYYISFTHLILPLPFVLSIYPIVTPNAYPTRVPCGHHLHVPSTFVSFNDKALFLDDLLPYPSIQLSCPLFHYQYEELSLHFLICEKKYRSSVSLFRRFHYKPTLSFAPLHNFVKALPTIILHYYPSDLGRIIL